ncbi:hypothetical protein FB451DRAFT_1187313 [Mycena latifolia]|nr:hypothetical protein FB451DRAFT_1187313 [Mycena latifolia]
MCLRSILWILPTHTLKRHRLRALVTVTIFQVGLTDCMQSVTVRRQDFTLNCIPHTDRPLGSIKNYRVPEDPPEHRRFSRDSIFLNQNHTPAFDEFLDGVTNEAEGDMSFHNSVPTMHQTTTRNGAEVDHLRERALLEYEGPDRNEESNEEPVATNFYYPSYTPDSALSPIPTTVVLPGSTTDGLKYSTDLLILEEAMEKARKPDEAHTSTNIGD